MVVSGMAHSPATSVPTIEVTQQEITSPKSSQSDEERGRPDVDNSASIVFDPDEERMVLRKCDIQIIPILGLLFLASSVDRINLGNARIQGLEEDLGMDGNDFNIALVVFFIPYIFLGVPSNLILKHVKPYNWISFIMASWGIVTACQGFVRSLNGLIACRVLLGIFEAGFVPGCLYLISMYYKKHELQWRFNLFFCFNILAGAFSGLFAFAVAYMDGICNLGSWCWIFFIQGLVTVVIALVGRFVIVDWPENATFLTLREREILLQRLSEDTGDARMDRIDRDSTKRVFSDWKIFYGVFIYFGIVNTPYSTSFFIPTILKELGWTSLLANLMTVPIFIAATVFALVTAYLTDHFKHRSTAVFVGCFSAVIGYSLLLHQDRIVVGVRYMALYFVTVGGYIAQPVTLVWLNNNMGGHYKRAVAAGVQFGLGSCAGFVASSIYIESEAPGYNTGFRTSLCLLGLSIVVSLLLLFVLGHENNFRRSGDRDYHFFKLDHELYNLGDDHPDFRYTY